MVSIKVDKILTKALEYSYLSKQNFNHAAIITKGSKPVVFGFNNDRSVINGKISVCSHAEMHAILKWRNTHFRDVKDRARKENKFNLYVIRRSNCGKKNFSNSEPCKVCSEIIKKCNFNKVIWSTGNSDILKVIKNTSHLSCKHKTSAHKYLENNINYFSRLNYI